MRKPRRNGKKPNKTSGVVAYTDGGCLVNPGGPGGYGVVVINNETGEKREYSDSYVSTTNNRMEVMAILRALRETAEFKKPVTIYSDSQYAINCAKGEWGRNKNQDLWREYEELAKNRDVQYIWVRGHAGNRYNERCDELATIAMQLRDKKVDKGYDGPSKKVATDSIEPSGGAMGVTIRVPDGLDCVPEISSTAEYARQYRVNDVCAQTIIDFYNNKITSFKAYAKLKTGGIDFWSYKAKDVIIKSIGTDVWNLINEHIKDDKQAVSCAKWICRGLTVTDAIRKTLVDAEISAKCNAKRG